MHPRSTTPPSAPAPRPRASARNGLVLAHRWVGLALAVLLLPTALSGSVLVWRRALDEWLNPTLFQVAHAGQPVLTARQLADALLASHPEVHVRWLDPPTAPGRTAIAEVSRWPADIEGGRRVNQVFLDPRDGSVIAARSSVTPSLTRMEFVAWLRRFHYTWMLKQTGMRILGGVAILWLLDCLIGLLLTLPRRSAPLTKWRLAWQLRGGRLGYDLHRATGLWLGAVFAVLASSSVYLNLGHEVFVPVVEALARLLPDARESDIVATVLEWQQPLHTGEALALPGRLLVFAAGLAVPLLAATGVAMTLRKLRRRPRRAPHAITRA